MEDLGVSPKSPSRVKRKAAIGENKKGRKMTDREWLSFVMSYTDKATKTCTIPHLDLIEFFSKPKQQKPAQIATKEFIDTLFSNPAYSGLNIQNHLSQMDAWLSAHPGRLRTKKFIVNWLNKHAAYIPKDTKISESRPFPKNA